MHSKNKTESYMDIEDILKLKEIDQLESAILQFSKNTLASKKICGSLLIGVISIILKITNNTLDLSLYVACFLTLFFFWILDSQSYFYQRKLRIIMTNKSNELRKGSKITNGLGMPLNKDEKASFGKSLFNWSQSFYLIGFIIIGGVLVADLIGWIK